jgi:hypothetical protein
MGAHAGGNDEVTEALALEDVAGILGAVDNTVNWMGVIDQVGIMILDGKSYRSRTSASDIHQVSAPR